jgi:hypothetical protein
LGKRSTSNSDLVAGGSTMLKTTAVLAERIVFLELGSGIIGEQR